MIAEIVSVGTELLMGQIVNSDAQFLSQRLAALGIGIYHHTTVGDNPGRIRAALRQALARADLVVTTGGLGPTEDDLTKEMAAEVLGLPMALDEASLASIRAFFARNRREMWDNNAKQAYFPLGARILPNRKGTAPGCVMEKDGKRIAVLPGPPFELIDMYEQQLEPYLLSLSDRQLRSKFFRIVGIGESEVEMILKDLFHSDNPTLALYCTPGEVQARLTASCARGEDPEPLLAPLEAEIRARLGPSIYAEGLDMSLPRRVVELLRQQGLTLALAESCTGGMMASQIVDVPGASAALLEGHVVYANEAKVRTLGVREETLAAHGAVSEECALEMAVGARRISGAAYALSTTGIAGPGGGTPEKPVGLVYVGLACASGARAVRFELTGDRTRVRTQTSLRAFDMLRRTLEEASHA